MGTIREVMEKYGPIQGERMELCPIQGESEAVTGPKCHRTHIGGKKCIDS